MTNAPTTRETADHAELARLAEAATPDWDAETITENTVAYFGAFVPSVALALLSEIAALKGERDDLERHRDRLAITCQRRLDDWRDAQAKATQAERQRDELRKALERIADEAPYRSGYCQSDVEYGPALSADEMQAVARQALANQGAE